MRPNSCAVLSSPRLTLPRDDHATKIGMTTKARTAFSSSKLRRIFILASSCGGASCREDDDERKVGLSEPTLLSPALPTFLGPSCLRRGREARVILYISGPPMHSLCYTAFDAGHLLKIRCCYFPSFVIGRQ